MHLSSTSQSRVAIPALAVVAASCFVGSFPANSEISSFRRSGVELPSAYKGTAAWGARMRDSTDLYVYADSGAFDSATTRETTEQEFLIAKLRGWESLCANWDGEGSLKPELLSIRSASNFVCLLSPNAVVPEPLLHASGRAGLSWDDGEAYGELEFLSDRLAAYYFTNKGNKHKGVISFDGGCIPPVIAALIPHAIAS